MTLEQVLVVGLVVISAAAVAALPLSLYVVLRFYRDTASVNGTPLALAEKNAAGQLKMHSMTESHRHELKQAEHEAKLAMYEEHLNRMQS